MTCTQNHNEDGGMTVSFSFTEEEMRRITDTLEDADMAEIQRSYMQGTMSDKIDALKLMFNGL